MINDALFIIYIPFVKVQLNNKKLFEQFLDTWYMIFNIMNTLVSLIAPLVFKNWIGVNYSNTKFLIFVIPPLIITALSFIIFLLNRKAYIIKSIDRTAIKNFFLMIFKKNKTQTRIQIRDRNTRLKCVIGLLIVMMFYCVVTDQFNTMIVDFTDSSRLSNFSLFGISMKPCGSSLMSINGITVVLVTPVMFYFIYPYVIAKWSIYRKLCFAILLNQLSLFLGLSLHMINIQRDCIDSTFSPHFTWYIIPWVMNAISELIIFPITVKTITSVAPPDYVSFCTCLLWSTNGFASIFCYVINLFKLSEIIRCIIFITVCIVAFPIIYFAFSNEKQISVPEDINKEKSVFEKCE
ncbi:hypothetical protein CDIK_0363 [Cucumispora dikerogammari]|nr:hypothetical protein CDIK_0363 [Cucumispora dikerogammari]